MVDAGHGGEFQGARLTPQYFEEMTRRIREGSGVGFELPRSAPLSSAIMRGEAPLVQDLWNDPFGLDEKIADLPNPTYEKVESTLKLENLEHALPLLGLRVMIHPDKTDYYDRELHNKTGTIVSTEGEDYDVKNMISRYKEGRRNSTWKVKVRFDDGETYTVKVLDMLPIGTTHEELYIVDISGYGKLRWSKETYESKINEYIIVKGRNLRSLTIADNAYRQKLLDQC